MIGRRRKAEGLAVHTLRGRRDSRRSSLLQVDGRRRSAGEVGRQRYGEAEVQGDVWEAIRLE